MPSYVQVWDEQQQKYVLVPKGEHINDQHFISVKGFDAFRSPVDGSIISSQRDLRNHNRRNGVVDSREFPPSYYKEIQQRNAREIESQSRERKAELSRILNSRG